MNEYGQHPRNEDESKVIDGNSSSKWLDLTKSGLILKFNQPFPVKWVSFITADDCPWRDPVRFLIKGSFDGISWLDLANTMGDDFVMPLSRKQPSPWVMLTMPLPISDTG